MNKPWTRPRTSWHELNKQHHCDIWTKMILAFLQSKTFIATQIKLQSTKNLALSLCQAISRWQGSFWQLCNQLKLNLVINFALSEYLSDLQPYPWILKPVFPSLNCDNMSSYTITNALINWITSQKQEMPLLTVFSKRFIFPSVLQRALFYVLCPRLQFRPALFYNPATTSDCQSPKTRSKTFVLIRPWDHRAANSQFEKR